jgi:hypothetical protein
MLDVQQAVTKAMEFAKTVLEPDRVNNVLLEEIESSARNGHDVWLVTVSFPKQAHPLAALSLPDRDYKTVTLDAETGKVLSMKIREFAMR